MTFTRNFFPLDAVGCVVELLVETIHGQVLQVIAVGDTKKTKRKMLSGQNEICIGICTIIAVIKLIQILSSLKVS